MVEEESRIGGGGGVFKCACGRNCGMESSEELAMRVEEVKVGCVGCATLGGFVMDVQSTWGAIAGDGGR